MPYLDINTISPAELQQVLSKHDTVVACLCAAWCDVCESYRPNFKSLAEQHSDILFLWIDIEDQADLLGDLDIENFPTLLIQRHHVVTFYGEMLPDTHQLNLVIQSQSKQTVEQLELQACPDWQIEANLLLRLRQH